MWRGWGACSWTLGFLLVPSVAAANEATPAEQVTGLSLGARLGDSIPFGVITGQTRVNQGSVGRRATSWPRVPQALGFVYPPPDELPDSDLWCRDNPQIRGPDTMEALAALRRVRTN